MSATLLRASSRSLPPLRRHVSTSAKVAIQWTTPRLSEQPTEPHEPSEAKPTPRRPRPTLPREKLRALVSLYHQSENFITPQNLSKAIDRAFIDQVGSDGQRVMPEVTYNDLVNISADQKQRPKVGTAAGGSTSYSRSLSSSDSELWSQQRPERETELVNALYGTMGTYKPGLEMLEDKYDWISQKLEEEREESKERESQR